ncbi:hypothetical protein [Endozoicomonas sp. 8E]|uniref:hypothetical protein n=1 Tax=Endozoicomonas sp. 8E TaxID=3035692 RepID=UPI002938E056|nr:hypothetical protein [Endozoicomonas sp. 8E]WOG28187.1 hypothetical protein P6910_00635 [Endozoicomonas sp. 8E]
MLRAGLSIFLFVLLLLGAFYSHGYDDYNKDKIVTDKSGRQRCKQCDLSLGACDCRCDQCGKRFREKRQIAQATIRKKGQSYAKSARGKDPKSREVYLSTENTCQCEEKPLSREPPSAPVLRLGPRKRMVAFDGPSTSQMVSLEPSVSGFSGEMLPLVAFTIPDPAPVTDEKNQLDCEWMNQRCNFSVIQLQTLPVDETFCQQKAFSASSFNVCYLETAMDKIVLETSSGVLKFQQLLTQVQAAIQQDVIAGLISVGWMSEYTRPLGTIETLKDRGYLLTLPVSQGGYSFALIIIEHSLAFVFLLNQDGEVMGYASNKHSLFVFAINCYLDKSRRGQLYQVHLPDDDVFNLMVENATKAFNCLDKEAVEALQAFDDDDEVEVFLVSDNATGHDIAIRQCFMNQMSGGLQKIPLPQKLDESQLPDLYPLLSLMEMDQAMMALNIDLEVDELKEFNSIQMIMDNAIGEGSFAMVIQEPDESTFAVFISVNGAIMTLRMLCFSDSLGERASLKASTGLVCEWNEALQVLMHTLRTGYNLKLYRIRPSD